MIHRALDGCVAAGQDHDRVSGTYRLHGVVAAALRGGCFVYRPVAVGHFRRHAGCELAFLAGRGEPSRPHRGLATGGDGFIRQPLELFLGAGIGGQRNETVDDLYRAELAQAPLHRDAR